MSVSGYFIENGMNERVGGGDYVNFTEQFEGLGTL